MSQLRIGKRWTIRLGKPGRVAREMGNVDAEFSKSDGKVVEAAYYTPLLAHASMEPPAAVAEFKDGKVVTWANTQNPQAVQDTVAKALGISKDAVTCHVTLLGGGFGRKSKPDYVAEAALISRQVGKPVKIVWSREDDIQFDYYHSPASMYMKAVLGEGGKPTAWLQRTVYLRLHGRMISNEQYGGFQLGMGWTDMPYQIGIYACGKRPRESACSYWLAPLRSEYLSRLRCPILHG